MKKLLVFASFAFFLAACNNSANKDADKDTTTTITREGDTVTKVTDMDTTLRGGGDTTIKKTVDTDTTKRGK